jgi:hypothetical protein
MPDDITPARVTTLAAAARITLSDEAAARVARAVAPAVARFAAENIAMPLETEPSTFLAIQHKDAAR